jgi:acetyltransferase-like isoleucine patch superfamily enzyme
VSLIFFGLILLAPPPLKPWLMRVLLGARIGRGVQIGWFAGIYARHIALGDYAELRALTLIRCDGDVSIGDYSIVSSFTLVYGSADLLIGRHSYIGPQTLINCDEPVRIGNHSALGARCMIYTHGSYLPYTEGFPVRFGAVTLGDYVWCAAGVFLHPGVSIGDSVLVNSRSVVTQDIAGGEVVEGFPARRVVTMDRVRRSMTPRRVDAALNEIVRHFADLELTRVWRLRVQRDGALLRFTYHGHDYVVTGVPADERRPLQLPEAARLVLLVNRPNWTPPDGVLTLDFTTLRCRHARDPIYNALRIFLARYYGVQFEFTEEA